MPNYKRAQERYSWDAWAPREKWAGAEARWARHDIRASSIYAVLRQAATARMDFEDNLVNDRELAKEEIAYRAFVRGFNQRLHRVFKYLGGQYSWLPEAQVAEGNLRNAIAQLAETLASMAPHVHRTFGFKGRPGEPWLLFTVARLFKIFRSHGMHVNATVRAIVEVLGLAGHADVANVTSVKRQIKKR